MNWFYAEGGQQKGPITEHEFQALVQAGAITGATLVWREGMANWQAYGSLQAPPPPPSSAPEPLVAPLGAGAGTPVAAPDADVCLECGRAYPRSDMVAYSGRYVCAGCRDAFFQKVREGIIAPSTPGAGHLVLASFGIRWGAKIIDGILLTALSSAISLPVIFLLIPAITRSGRPEGAAIAIMLGVQFLAMFLQFAVVIGFKGYFYGKFGATPGKMALGLKVVRPDGSDLTYGRSFGRAAAEVLNGFTLYIGYLIAAFDDEKRGLHDRICDTRVIRKA